MRYKGRIIALLAVLSLLAACGAGASDGTSGGDGGTSAGAGGSPAVVVGSQAYYSNEIIAEIVSQVLEGAGYTVDRQFQIGSREVYLPELLDGTIDVLPEYSGNLLQYLAPDASARTPEEVLAALDTSLPSGLRALAAAAATDQDSYTVTREFAQEHGLSEIGDLAEVTVPLVMGANSEFGARTYGPEGVRATYGVTIELLPIEDYGGPLTIRALLDGTVNVADIYTASPAVAENDLVTLADPESLILSQQVVPIVSAAVDAQGGAAIEQAMARLDTPTLIELNRLSTADQQSSEQIAREWLTSEGLLP